MMLFLGNLFHKWHAPSRGTQFDTLAGKLPVDIVNKIMSFWSPGYPFLDEIKSVSPKIVTARNTFAEELLSVGYPDAILASDEEMSSLWFSECDTDEYREQYEHWWYADHIMNLYDGNCQSEGADVEGGWINGIIRGALGRGGREWTDACSPRRC